MKQQCKRCVMDNVGDPYITFDENGYCNYCTDALQAKESLYNSNAEGKRKLDRLFNKIKSQVWIHHMLLTLDTILD